MYAQVIQPYDRLKMETGKQYDDEREAYQCNKNTNNALPGLIDVVSII